MSMYDLTGADPAFLREDVRFRVFEPNQALSLGEPAFASSINIWWMEDGVGTLHPLTNGVHWTYTNVQRDLDAMSYAKLLDNNFVAVLVDTIINLDNPGEERTYVVEYQAFKQKEALMDYGDNGPAPTPGIMEYLISNVSYLKEVKDPLGDITSETIGQITVLDEDRTGLAAENLIENEVHTVDVPSGKQVIRPSAGSFYKHDVVVVRASDDAVLVEGTDYTITGLNRPKNAIAEHTSGVYEYIFLIQPIVGQVKVTYRAFGGDVTVADINAIKDVLAAVTDLVENGDLLTMNALVVSPVFTTLVNRIAELEDDVYHYVTGTHQYEATSDGKHWFTIAELHRDAWNVDTLRTAQVHLALRSVTQHWAYEAMLAIDIDHPTDQIKAKVLASSSDKNHFSLGNYGDIDERNIPALRIIWKDDGTASGALLQVGMKMVAGVEEILVITDKSGNASDITIRDNIIGVDAVADDNVELPDAQIWVDGDADMYKAEYILCPDDGYVAWAGAYPVHLLAEESWEPVNATIHISDFDPSDVKKVTFYVYDRIDDRMLVASVEHVNDGNEILTGGALYYITDLCGLSYKLDTNGTLYLMAATGTHSKTNQRFDLRQIVFNF